jgi:hypothetical protein
MTAEVIPFKEPVAPTPTPAICTFCKQEMPKGSLALRSIDGGQWMCRGCIQDAYIRLGASA